MNILIVEDDPNRIRYFRRHLIGAVVDWVKTAVEAAGRLNAQRYDVIFLDHDLHYHGDLDPTKTGNGMQVAYIIAQRAANAYAQQAHPSLPLVIVHSHNPTGSAHIVRHLRQARVPVKQRASAWLDEMHLEELVKYGRWSAPARAPQWSEEFGWPEGFQP